MKYISSFFFDFSFISYVFIKIYEYSNYISFDNLPKDIITMSEHYCNSKFGTLWQLSTEIFPQNNYMEGLGSATIK